MIGVHQRSVEVSDSPITRKQTYTSLPRPVQCARCTIGDIVKVEFLCKECCDAN